MNICARLAMRLGGLPARLETAAGEAARAASERAAQFARDSVPVDSGELRGSICAEKTGAGSARACASAPHAAMVEYGTSRMGPRPFMLPASQAAQQDFARLAREAASAAIKEI